MSVHHVFRSRVKRHSSASAMTVEVSHTVLEPRGAVTRVVQHSYMDRRVTDSELAQAALPDLFLQAVRDELAVSLLTAYLTSARSQQAAQQTAAMAKTKSPTRWEDLVRKELEELGPPGKEEPGDSCEVCWGTGFVQGFGAPCPKGCKP